MSSHPSDNGATARLWAIRVQDPAFADWAGLTEWLESNPAHLAAYEGALDEDAWATELYAQAPAPLSAVAVPASRKVPQRRWFGVAGAIAAAVALVGGWVLSDRNGAQEIVTLAGEHRTIELADGSRIILNGATRVLFDPDRPRHVELAQGEALFEVRHNARDPFVVMAGGTRLLDVGTVFNVVREDGVLDLAVAHGAVIYEPGRDKIRVGAGEGLSRSNSQAAPVLRKLDPEAVGGWRSHQLQFDNAPLDRVAHDLSRNLGVAITTGSGSENFHFTGTLSIAGSPEQVFARVGPLLGVNFAAQGDAWSMIPAHASSP